ncbi:hypothetical protein KJ885_04555, partial [Patescibacteria group bacterium]|nr:hypothetical protein [Patescibacteria group bacterium]
NMEKEPGFHQQIEETKIVDGKKYRKVFSGYTLRQYFSHSTPEKGPGPGWDTKRRMLEKYNVDEPSELPDEPFYVWEPVEDEA